jgi:hydroxypyruvate reductase
VVEDELSGDAADAGRGFLRRTELLALIWGETTVELGTSSGVGGRNQEAALAAAIEGEGEDGWLLAALATDGVDGNSQAAGAIVDGGTADRIRATGLDPVACLEEHDSHPALAAAGDLLITGPTGTNVADLWIVARGIG